MRYRFFSDSNYLSEAVFTQPIQNTSLLKFVHFNEYPADSVSYEDVMKVVSEGNSKIYTSDSVSIENSTMYFYYARGIGLIKRYDPMNDFDWILVGYFN